MSKQQKTHFMTAYLEFLLEAGIRSEYYYCGDASRYVRFLLAQSDAEDVERFLTCAGSLSYRQRLIKTLRKFYAFAQERLDIPNNPMDHVRPHPPPKLR